MSMTKKPFLQVHWTLMKQENIQRQFKKEMRKNFTVEGDHSFFEALLKRKSTFIIHVIYTSSFSK